MIHSTFSRSMYFKYIGSTGNSDVTQTFRDFYSRGLEILRKCVTRIHHTNCKF